MLTSLCCASLSLFSLSLRLLSFFLYFIFRSRALAHIVLSLHKLMLCWTVLWSPCSWLMVFCASSSFPTSLVFFFSDARIHLIDLFIYRLALALFRFRLKLLFFYSRISFASSVFCVVSSVLWPICCRLRVSSHYRAHRSCISYIYIQMVKPSSPFMCVAQE